MTGASQGVHWASLLTVVGVGLGGVAGTLWRLASIIQRWRDEAASGVGELAGLVADWCDEVDDHLDSQDAAMVRATMRLGRLEQAAGVPPVAPYLPRRVRRASRRVDVAEKGLRASHERPGLLGDGSVS